MTDYEKPLPRIDAVSKPYWDAARRHELRLPKCTECQTSRTYFEKWCSICGSEEFTWARMSGKGKVWSHCEFHKVYFSGFATAVPYNVVVVELDEGPLLISNMVDVTYSDLVIGMKVEVIFDDVTPDVSLVKFRPS